MADNGSRTLTPKQVTFLSHLLDPRNRTVAAAAKAADVPERTALRWMATDVFRAAIDAEVGAVLDTVTRTLVSRTPTITDVLTELAVDRNQSPSIRLRAATAVADLALRLYESRTIERRVAELERVIYANT